MDYHHHARLTVYSREQLANKVIAGEPEPPIGRQVGCAAFARACNRLQRQALN